MHRHETRPSSPRWWPRRLGLALLLTAGVGSPGLAATVHGVVVDPQERVVAGAVVSLACGDVTKEHPTDAEGRFRFHRPGGFASCTVTAGAAGLTPSHPQPVGGSSSLRIRLGLPTLSESLTVRPREGEVGRSAFRSLASVSLSGPELRAVSDDTGDLVRYARARAGITRATASHVYVDGLPAGSLPPAETIDRIVVDGDPFSAEYADGSAGHIDIATRVPDRRLRWSLGGSGLGLGGRSVLDDQAESTSRSWRLGLSGPVPRLPVTFSADATLFRSREEVPIRALTPAGVDAPPTAATPASSGSVRLALSYAPEEATRASVALFGAHGRQSNAGLSGITLPEAGMSLRSDTRGLRATFTTRSAAIRHRAGLVASWSENTMTATSRQPGVAVSGTWIGGGADTTAAEIEGATWTLKYVAEATSGRSSWKAGAVLSRCSDAESVVVNSGGRLVFESPQAYADARAGLGAGSWFGARGDGRTAYASTAVSPFVEADVLRSAHVRVRAGLRADHQSEAGTLISPRLSGAAVWRGATLRWGGGVFVHGWPTGVLLRALQNDRSHLDRFLVTSAALSDPEGGDDARAVPLDSRLAPDLTRPRDLVLRASVERPLAGLTPGIEYTWRRATHRLGSRRLPDGVGWVDTLESNRFARKHQLHLRLLAAAGEQRISAHYTWTRSRDDTDGPLSFPESPADLAAEEARSAGVAPHEVSVVGRFALPGGFSLTIVERWHSSRPYNVTTGTDPTGIGLYSFRGGRPRNSGDGPGYHWVSLHASRRIALPFPGGPNGQKTYASVSLHVENLLNDRNYVTVGGVAGSPLLGVPLVALPGRSLRLSVSFDR
jgi:hypothetical protein